MPIKVESYIAIGSEVWQQEKHGRRRVANCASKAMAKRIAGLLNPIPMVLHCPVCGAQHVDAPEPDSDWTNPPHKSHLCHSCNTVWRPADISTNGVKRIVTRGEKDTWPDR